MSTVAQACNRGGGGNDYQRGFNNDAEELTILNKKVVNPKTK